MRIFKRLSADAFAAFETGSVRIGSLKYYQTIEDSNRNDSGEGPLAVHIRGRESGTREIGADEFNRVAGAIGSIYRIKDPKLKFVLNGPGALTMQSDINVLVFCASADRSSDEKLDAKFGARVVEIVEPDHFAKSIAGALNQEIQPGGRIDLRGGTADSISFAHRPVEYLGKSPIPPEEAVGGFVFNPMDVFKKDLAFQNEAEYRFQWFPYCHKTQTLCSVGIGFRYIDLQIPEIWSTLRVVT